MEAPLSIGDRVIIANAINWTLHVPFSRSPAPVLSRDDLKRLKTILDRASAMQDLSTNDVQLVVTCVQAFSNEIGHSPAEVEVVTGLPSAALASLLDRLKDS